MSNNKVIIYTDGSCLGNPGPGGWGVLYTYKGNTKEVSGGEPETTNNRMELMAAIVALEGLKRPCEVTLISDSQYVRKGITEWIQGWVKKGWKNSQGKEVVNRDLWERLLKAVEPHTIEWQWVKGHSGHPENEKVDFLARNEAAKFKK